MPMPVDEIPAAILFADIGGSTQLYDTLGDVRGHQVTAECLECVSEQVRRHGGRVIKTIGDEVMSTFPAATAAVEAARDIQHAVTASSTHARYPVTIHVGLHYGLVLPEEGDVFGDTVNVAARMVGLAKPGEILTTRETVDEIEPGLRAQTRQVDHRGVKGKRAEIDIYEVLWQTANLTQINELPEFEVPEGRLLLVLGDQQAVLDYEGKCCTIGRAPDRDLVITDMRASRDHGKIEVRRGKFILQDHSANGTIVRTPDGERISLRREEMVLPHAGNIGIAPNPDDSPLIIFDVET
jgi:adenylate cyclase